MSNIDNWITRQYNSGMKAAVEPKKRKPALERRQEIIEAASHLAVQEGLERLTVRRVAEELGVAPGLVSHYFPVNEDLIVAAFANAASSGRNYLFASLDPSGTPIRHMASLLKTLSSSESSGEISLLWMDAWQATRRRPNLRAEVASQMLAWQDRMRLLIVRGVKAGMFDVARPKIAAGRIMSLIDGLSVQAAMRKSISFGPAIELVIETVERELGLSPGALKVRG
jgi:AcrR family transcriptional regulator